MPRVRGSSSVVDDTAAWRPQPGTRTSILFDVYVLGQRNRALVAEAMADAGMRPDTYAAYSVVFEMGPITLSDLAAELGIALTTVADTIREMDELGHLRRTPHPTDQRAMLLALTPRGLRAHRRASGCFERAYQALHAELGTLEESSARDVLQQLARAAQQALSSLRAESAGRAG
jgi:DNA-binding MarR family transcriptional regulator